MNSYEMTKQKFLNIITNIQQYDPTNIVEPEDDDWQPFFDFLDENNIKISEENEDMFNEYPHINSYVNIYSTIDYRLDALASVDGALYNATIVNISSIINDSITFWENLRVIAKDLNKCRAEYIREIIKSW